MSRQQLHQQKLQMQQQQQQQQQQLLVQQQIAADNAAAAEAAEHFDLLCVATTMRQILGLHRNMCELVGLRPAPLNEFYPKLKAKVRSWKAQALWKKFDARAAHRVYGKGNACAGTRVLVIGAGPCGLRTAIEAQLLGAKVVVLEKRDRITRNNVLHLWPFVITDLRNLGAKKFYGKFCAGSIDHISIRQLQCMLLKVALLLGVEIHEGVSFEHAIEPSGDGLGWHAAVTPADHAVSHYEFDVLIGADGKRNMLAFRRKEFRGKLAIAITANFINKKTEAEAKVEEISGVAFIFNQSFFKELYQRTGIDLENIVYYKDETHYFVMTAKKHSLIDKGVIIEDLADPAELLAAANVDTQKLHDYAREAAEFSTQYQMPNLEFAVNHYGKPDVAMFDFTSMFAAEMSCRVTVRKGFRLMQCLVGDSLLEPFWPTGSGCARGFLSSMDAAYAIKLWSNPQNSILGVMAQRESIYRLLGQTTPDTLQRDISAYTVDPATRYPNLNRESVNVWQVKHLIDTDDPTILEQTFMDTNTLQAAHIETPGRRKRRSGDNLPQGASLLRWITAQLHAYDFCKELKEPSDILRNGRVLCALINRYRPDLVDFSAVKDLSPIDCNEFAFKILEKELRIDRIMNAKDSLDLTGVESRIWLHYLEQICELFRGEIPHVKHSKIDFSDLRQKYRINHAHAQPDFSKLLQIKPKAKSPMQDLVDVPQAVVPQRRSVLDEERVKRQRRHEQLLGNGNGATAMPHQSDTPRRSKKRRSAEKCANIEERQQRLQDIEQNRQDRMSKRRQQRYHQTQNFYKSLQMLHAGNLLREKDDETPFEDYSIFLYRQQAPVFNDRVKELERKLLFPDRERGDIPSALPRNAADEQFSDRIKNMEQRITSRGNAGTDKKPKDLMRAIGKIDSNDWNVREIEKKIELSKKTEVHGPKGREKVPKWNREQFLARHNKMSKPQRQDSREEAKFREIDQTLKNLDKQLKEGHNLDVGERGRNKVASIAGQFGRKDEHTLSSEEAKTPVVPKSSSKVALAFKKQAASEKCRFCKQTVYLMEKITVEGLVLHRGCLKCHHCHTNLRLGGYAFDRDDPHGRFYCTQHFKLPAKPVHRVVSKGRKSTQAQPQVTAANANTAVVAMPEIDSALATVTDAGNTISAVDNESKHLLAATMDLLDHEARAPSADAMSDDEANVIDEQEWSGRNFFPESNNDSESDLSSSDESDTESESDIYEEADDSPFGAQTLQLATDWIGKQHYADDSDDSDDFYDSSEGMADDGKDDTEGEEFKKARELRREEVRLLPLPANLPTDTETELINQENKENVNLPPQTSELDNLSAQTVLSDKSFQSARSQTTQPPTAPITRTELEKLEQNSNRKFSAEIDAISEKLYHLNNMVKMNKDLEILAKENLVKSDILKKLTLKEKWLAENTATESTAITATNENPNATDLPPKSKFDEKLAKVLTKPADLPALDLAPKPVIAINLDELKPRTPNFNEVPKVLLKKPGSSTPTGKLSRNNSLKQMTLSPQPERKGSSNVSRSSSTKSNASAHTPRAPPRNKKVAQQGCDDNKMQIQNILNIVKKIDLSRSSSMDEDTGDEGNMGKLCYDAEHKFSPQTNRRMSTKLKEIESKNFAGTMDTIKAQLVMPTVSTQAGPDVDLSKYFPNQKQEKSNAASINKNQKTLKDVDLAKYFPTSPVPQRRAVETVADRLKKSQTEKSVATATEVDTKKSQAGTPNKTKAAPKRQASAETFSLRAHQLDGAIDLTKKKTPVKTTVTTIKSTPKGKIKIIKKIVPKGTKAKKTASAAESVKKEDTLPKNAQTVKCDESERILDEILADGELRSPSLEYQKLFKGEKSPSDVSDKIERILAETGFDLGISPKETIPNPKRLLKTKSLGEGEFDLKPKNEASVVSTKEAGDRPVGVQNLLKRFESLSSVNSDEHIFKLRRMESSTSNLNRSRESIMSRDSLISRESDSMSDLEKTMEYLRNEWRNEATNFLQKKRATYFGQKRTDAEAQEEISALTAKKQELKQSNVNVDTKVAKYFGIKQKSPEKRKSPIKKAKSPNKKAKSPLTQRHVHNSLEELAKISSARQAAAPPKKAADIINKFELNIRQTNRKEEQSRLDSTAKDLNNQSRRNSLLDQTACADSVATITPNSKLINIESQQELHAYGKEEGVLVSAARSLETTPTPKGTEITITDVIPPNAQSAEVQARPLVEDIKNLPKTGCDKSLNSSRRGSQASSQSRRSSDLSLTSEALQQQTAYLTQVSVATNVDELFQDIVDELIKPAVLIDETAMDECDSLCTTISKSPSAQPITVLKRGSSEDESIEKLFSHFSDEMLVHVEFDSNDELVGITPRATATGNMAVDVAAEDINTADDEAQRDFVEKLESLERDEVPVRLNPTEHEHFPTRPERRPKSKSSSSESSTPIAPHRIKKKLAQLTPVDMPPSVQDLIHEALFKQVLPDDVEKARVDSKGTLKFPRLHYDEAEVAIADPEVEEKADLAKRKAVEIEVVATKLPEATPDFPKQKKDEMDKVQPIIELLMNTTVEATPSLMNPKNLPTISSRNSSKGSLNELPIRNSSKGSLGELPTRNPSKSSLNELPQILTPPKLRSKESSLEWDMEKLPNSPMPRRKNMPAPTATAQSKESSLEWDMEKLPNSPMPPRRKNTEVAEAKLREVSPTSSINILNNLPDDIDNEATQRRQMKELEKQRRQALIKRDESYQVEQNPIVGSRRDSNQSSSNSSTKLPPPTPPPSRTQSQKNTPLASRRGTQDSLLSKKEGTPPMFKKLEIPSDAASTQSTTTMDTSRRSSFAFIELLSNKEPVIVPMPKKLDLPKIELPKYVPEPNCDEPVAEVFKDRPWPKPQNEGDSATDLNCDGNDEVDAPKLPEYANRTDSPPPEIFKNRQWPDGRTKFEHESRAESLDADDILGIYIKKRANKHKLLKPRSQSPQFNAMSETLGQSRRTSRSYNDLKRLTPYTSHTSLDSLARRTPPARPASYAAPEEDSSTRKLLDRSKQLHNRKRDFVNERVVERNPYMRDVIRSERLGNDDASNTLQNYRAKTFKTPPSPSSHIRFPTTRALGRQTTNSRDYLGTPFTDYQAGRRTHVAYLPEASSSAYTTYNNKYPTSVGYATPTSTRSSHLNELLRGSSPSSRYSSREYTTPGISKDSCVQTDSESTSAVEVELNSATEISTDSEFDNDELIRQAPKIYIDDTHLRKPTKVQIKSSVITSSAQQQQHQHGRHSNNKVGGGSYLAKYQTQPPMPQFKPLVQVDPTLLTNNRGPLQNPRPGDYILNKTASTEGIASKKSLELKKRYLLGEPANGNKIQKSGSTSVLDSRIRSFQSNISECQKLLNPSSNISAGMKTFLDCTSKLGENSTSGAKNDAAYELMRSATTNILNDLKVEIKIQKAPSSVSTDNEKENVFVNSKNELNKGMEYSETVNTTLLESLSRKTTSSTTSTSLAATVIECIDLVTPEKKMSPVIDLTAAETPKKMLDTNVAFIDNMQIDDNKLSQDSNKIIDLPPRDTTVKRELSIIEETKPDVSKDAKERIPDILGHIQSTVAATTATSPCGDEHRQLLCNSDEEKHDAPEKQDLEQYEHDIVQIQVPNIPWSKHKPEHMSTTTTTTSGSSCGSSTSGSSSSIEDIQHYILDSTTSPDTQTTGIGVANKQTSHNVPRVEIHDSSGTLMQVDSLMIIDGKYIGDPEDVKFLDMPEGVVIPETPTLKTSVLEDEHDADLEPITATPEPVECTVIEPPPPLPNQGPPLPEKGPPKSIKPANLKFDTRNENKIESLKNLPLIVEQQAVAGMKAVKPVSLNLSCAQKTRTPDTPTTPTMAAGTPDTPLNDNDKTPTADLLSRGSDSETELTGTGQALTETELSDWTADDCISENFVDMEFVLNSNKGTIKRNKKERKKLNSAKMPSMGAVRHSAAKSQAPVAEFEGILKSINIDDIEFMDTGSEGSCAEAYSATNTALLHNRGYMEYIEGTPKQSPRKHATAAKDAQHNKNNVAEAKREEKLGIDYIEQGAYIMSDDMLKTPVNESPPHMANDSAGCGGGGKSQTQTNSLMTQSLTDSSTLNDLDEDSLGMGTKTNTNNTTTEESEALTVVTSPLETSSPQILAQFGTSVVTNTDGGGKDSETPSSSEKQPRTSQSTCTPSSTSTASSTSHATPPRQQDVSSTGGGVAGGVATSSSTTKQNEAEFSYEEYVRALQQKITQISTARDSLDSRKQRRKSSKGESPNLMMMPSNNQTQTTVIEASPPPNNYQQREVDEAQIYDANAITIALQQLSLQKVPEIPTLTSKLEEITKERTKQKDLIHDLVMDKLQSKKQLNAEKRLHRSRQRSLLTSGYASGASLSPTPKIAAASTTNDTNCTNQAHYHVSTAASATATPSTLASTSKERDRERQREQRTDERRRSSSTHSTEATFNPHNPLQKSATYVSPYRVPMEPIANPNAMRAENFKQRPFSEHLDAVELDAYERFKLQKTQSFSTAHSEAGVAASTASADHNTFPAFATPVAPKRQQRGRADMDQEFVKSITASTENLRSEARMRARLKSNSELGLSPEEKMQLLRKRLQYEPNQKQAANTSGASETPLASAERERDLGVRAHKMSASKSVNDLAYMSATGGGQHKTQQADALSPSASVAHQVKSLDFTSDPNLMLSSSSSSGAHALNEQKPTKTKSGVRQKDPERRKSLIQSLSSFFHKGGSSASGANGASVSQQSKHKETATSAGNSAASERPGTSGSVTTTVSGSSDSGGVFSRFRISPRSKEKSKEKDGRDALTTTTSQDFLNTANSSGNDNKAAAHKCQHEQHQQHISSHKNYTSTKTNITATTTTTKPTTTYSASNPQLYIHKAKYLAADEQLPPPIPPLPLNYQRSDDESYAANETREHKKQRAISKATRQAELKRLRIAQEIQREQEEIEVQLKELEARGVLIEKALRGEAQNFETLESTKDSDEKLLKELLEIWRNITQLKKRDEELGIRQQELQLEYRHAQLKEELNLRLSCNKLDKSSADVAAEGAILNEMLEIVAKRAALRPTNSNLELTTAGATTSDAGSGIMLTSRSGQPHDNDESNI